MKIFCVKWWKQIPINFQETKSVVIDGKHLG